MLLLDEEDVEPDDVSRVFHTPAKSFVEPDVLAQTTVLRNVDSLDAVVVFTERLAVAVDAHATEVGQDPRVPSSRYLALANVP